MSKFKYVLFPDKPYMITFEDFDGNPFTVEVPGEEIVAALRREYALERAMKYLDNEADEE